MAQRPRSSLTILIGMVSGLFLGVARAEPPLPRGNATLPEVVENCKGALVATLLEVGDPEPGPPGASDYASKWRVAKVLRGAYPETAHLSFRVQSLPEKSRERPPTVGESYILITYEANAGQIATILDAGEENLRTVQGILSWDDEVKKRSALWQALWKALPEKYKEIDVYAENSSLSQVLFRSQGTTLTFSLQTGKVEEVHHMKALFKINRITYEQREAGGYYALWYNGQRELTISAEK